MAVDAPGDTDERAPDLLHRALRNLRARPTVQALLAYGALGWAGLQFVGLVAESHPARGTLMTSALVLYAAGFVVVAFGAPVVLQGRHPLRSLMVVGVTVVSLGAGFLIRGLWTPPSEDDPFAPTDSVSIPDRDDPAPSPPPPEPDPVPVEPVDPVDRILALLSARYGDTDEVVEDVQVRRGGNRVLGGYEHPVSVRFYSTSAGYALNVDPGDGSRRFDLDAPGASIRTDVDLPTECGPRRYTLTATREGETARVRVEVDSAAARRAVERARILDECRIDPGGGA